MRRESCFDDNSDAVSQKPCNFRLHSFTISGYDDNIRGWKNFILIPYFYPGGRWRIPSSGLLIPDF